MRDQFVKDAGELFDQHLEAISKQIAEDHKMTVAFSAKLDMDSIPAVIETSISFSKRVSDIRHAEIMGPDMPMLPGLIEDARAAVEVKFDSDSDPTEVPIDDDQSTEGETPHVVAGDGEEQPKRKRRAKKSDDVEEVANA